MLYIYFFKIIFIAHSHYYISIVAVIELDDAYKVEWWKQVLFGSHLLVRKYLKKCGSFVLGSVFYKCSYCVSCRTGC